ncbi:helix-turn-helix domain-containing protein [Streptomyces sp. NPDC048506]|uniref:helix-turn-helix domain-containing protein n=1 Tax=Streptomyces sp. NPDC048506 TaxID=3155028 RepID=UPI00342A73F2
MNGSPDGGDTHRHQTHTRGRRPPRGEPLLDRAYRVLASFGPDTPVLSLTALAARADLPKATTFRIARRLVEHGALERTSSGHFTIGIRPRSRACPTGLCPRPGPGGVPRRRPPGRRGHPDRDYAPVAAISIIAPSEQSQPAAHIPAVVAMARAITRALATDTMDPSLPRAVSDEPTGSSDRTCGPVPATRCAIGSEGERAWLVRPLPRVLVDAGRRGRWPGWRGPAPLGRPRPAIC